MSLCDVVCHVTRVFAAQARSASNQGVFGGCMVYGLWFMVYGLRFTVYGLWFMVYGSWFMFFGFNSQFCSVEVTGVKKKNKKKSVQLQVMLRARDAQTLLHHTVSYLTSLFCCVWHVPVVSVFLSN